MIEEDATEALGTMLVDFSRASERVGLKHEKVEDQNFAVSQGESLSPVCVANDSLRHRDLAAHCEVTQMAN